MAIKLPSIPPRPESWTYERALAYWRRNGGSRPPAILTSRALFEVLVEAVLQERTAKETAALFTERLPQARHGVSFHMANRVARTVLRELAPEFPFRRRGQVSRRRRQMDRRLRSVRFNRRPEVCLEVAMWALYALGPKRRLCAEAAVLELAALGPERHSCAEAAVLELAALYRVMPTRSWPLYADLGIARATDSAAAAAFCAGVMAATRFPVHALVAKAAKVETA